MRAVVLKSFLGLGRAIFVVHLLTLLNTAGRHWVRALEVIVESKGSTVQKQPCSKLNYDPKALNIDLLE